MYLIMWNGPQGWEEVDSTDSLKSAEYLKAEYSLAFNSGAVKIVKVKT